jgi:hypothetical protein
MSKALREAKVHTSWISPLGRSFTSIAAPPELPIGSRWGATRLVVGASIDLHRDVFTGRIVEVEADGPRRHLPLSRAFARLPVARLEAV